MRMHLIFDTYLPDSKNMTQIASSFELATFGLRYQGFDPIVFDGTDPAAYVWALFEVAERQAACDEAVRLRGHRACPPRGLAVVPTPIQPRTPAPISLGRSAEPAGVAR